MTNEQIIFAEAQRLAEEGVINYTGRTFEATDGAGNKITVKETEDLHTFKIWKDLGFQVQKGQKAVAKIRIWKHSGAKQESMTDSNGNEVEYVDHGRMFMKVAAFFSRSQVEAI